MTSSFVLDLAEAQTLHTSGGKALNLSRLIRAGCPVPGGFTVTTAAYQLFVQSTGLQQIIDESLSEARSGSLTDAAASDKIRAAFRACELCAEIRDAISTAYGRLSDVRRVAVRSSGTSEDLAEASFAGLHDTFLGVCDLVDVLRKTVECFSSLWTERAVSYRRQAGITDVALAVVVQTMLDDIESSGVMFTVNPMTGSRDVVEIDATIGLGEALVSGAVNCDHWSVDAATGRILEAKIGTKLVKTVVSEHGGVALVDTAPSERAQPSLQARSIERLRELAGRIAAEYDGKPQDIEWIVARGEVFIVQARAVTTVFPTLAVPASWTQSGRVFALSFAAVQGVAMPLCPATRDIWRKTLSTLARVVASNEREPDVLFEAGERLWLNVTGLLRHTVMRPVMLNVLPAVFPGLASQLPAMAAETGATSMDGTLKALRFVASIVPRALRSLASPESAASRYEAALGAGVDAFERRAASARTASERLAVVDSVAKFAELVAAHLPAVVIPSMLMMRVFAALGGDVSQLLRSLPGNVTAQHDVALFEIVEAVRADAPTRALFDGAADGAALVGVPLAPSVQAAIDQFVARFGSRCTGEIDIAQPRLRETPALLFDMVKAMLPATSRSPRDMSADGARASQAAVEAACERASQTSWPVLATLKCALIRAVAPRVTHLFGKRESHKSAIVRVLDIARRQLLTVGDELCGSGALERREDIFMLRIDDARRALDPTQRDATRALAARNRAALVDESQRKQIPSALCSDGRFFVDRFELPAGMLDDPNVLVGSGVSNGVHEGTVRVLQRPEPTKMQHGDVLVVLGTDPSWSALFPIIGALVTETGGFLTHGSIVSREYGLPCVVGVHSATQRLKDGMRVRVNGTTGVVQILQ
jgi:phosphohistidine swiveling domain-containing protein